MDIRAYNRDAWDKEVEGGNEWTIPVSSEVISAARRGRWQVFLTPTIPVPKDWFPEMKGLEILCLASGGGQQGPILAAAGANVTALDNSPRQLEQDQTVADRESLDITTVEGDMADLSVFPDSSFDLIFHPVSNTFVPDVRPVWREAFRVLRKGGTLLSGFTNPAVYLFDWDNADNTGILQVKYKLPYSDLVDLTEEKRERHIQEKLPLEYSHTLDDQIGGQISAGFVITGFYEDRDREGDDDLLSTYTSIYMVTRAFKP